jgi:hypothetical protein
VRVPDEAGVGKAKVTYSFETWKEGCVTSTTIELPVVEPEPTREPGKDREQR